MKNSYECGEICRYWHREGWGRDWPVASLSAILFFTNHFSHVSLSYKPHSGDNDTENINSLWLLLGVLAREAYCDIEWQTRDIIKNIPIRNDNPEVQASAGSMITCVRDVIHGGSVKSPDGKYDTSNKWNTQPMIQRVERWKLQMEALLKWFTIPLKEIILRFHSTNPNKKFMILIV